MNKKSWLDKLFYSVGQQKYDYFLSGLKIKNEEVIPTKWKKYSECVFPVEFNGTSRDWEVQKFFDEINQRQILPIEVVLDIEDLSQLPKTIELLKKFDFDYYLFNTFSKGYHAHIFFDYEQTQSEKIRLIRIFQADEQKASDKCMIALEYCPHFKSGKIKELMENGN